MAGIVTNKPSWVAAVALSCGGMVLSAWASPPSSRPAGAASSHPRHLDLRPPSARELGDFPAVPADRHFGGRPLTPGLLIPGSRDSNLPGLGAAGEARVMGRAESLVRSFHREGLPVARLWENHSALLSLGLNAKGKPGLWLVQKTH
jgi:hypothetical protein